MSARFSFLNSLAARNLNHPIFLFNEEITVAEQCVRLGMTISYRPELKVIHREHLLRSLMPLYLGRTSSVVLETRGGGPEMVQHTVEQGCQTFEAMKPYLVDRWRFQ